MIGVLTCVCVGGGGGGGEGIWQCFGCEYYPQAASDT